MRLLAQTRNLEIPGSCFARPGMTGSALSLLDDETLHGAAEIAVLVRQPRRGEARAVGADQGFAIEQNPFSHRLARKTDGEIGVDEGPFPEIQRR